MDLDARITLAGQQNGVPVVGWLEIENTGAAPVGDVEIRIETDPPVSDPWVRRLELLQAEAAHLEQVVDLRLDPGLLSRQAEREAGRLKLEVRSAGQVLARETRDIEVLAPNQWPGVASLPELLAAWVMPNDPALEPVLRAASDRLSEETGDGSLGGYQSGGRERVVQLAQAVCLAMQDAGLRYISPPASFEITGQKVRTPEQVLRGGLGTCIDIAVLQSALLEQAGLHPLLVLVEGHAFGGVWLTDFTLHEPNLYDALPLRKRLELGEVMFFDSSSLAQGASLADAQRVAERYLGDSEKFHFAVDVTMARKHGIRPLPLRLDEEAASHHEAPTISGDGQKRSLEAIELAPMDDELERTTSTTDTRLDRWKRRLLDLSLRNRLINFKAGRTTVPLTVPAPAGLEDALAGDQVFDVMPRPALYGAGDPRRPELADGSTVEEAVQAHLRAEQTARRVHADLAPADLAKRLLELYRQSRSSFRETGAITLYLTIGMVRWYEAEASETPRLAPVLLVPVWLERGTGKQPFRLRVAEDETRVNVTLLRKFELDFGLDARGLADVPTDESGADVPRILRRFRRLVLNQDRWEVLDECWLGRFAFTKFLMWLDLEAKSEHLLENPVVRHIFEGGGKALDVAAPFVDAGAVDERPAADVLTVLDADPSQLAAVFAAEDGNSFVVEGPPGTGKSQTIANIIASVLARSGTVLFVSEKMAALEVVKRRLDQVGLGPFCLELHSHKASKKAVMEELAAAFAARGSAEPADWERRVGELEGRREALNRFAQVLRERAPFGPSLFDVCSRLIGLRDTPHLVVDHGEHGPMDRDRYDKLVDETRRLRSAAERAEPMAGHPFAACRHARWSPSWQRDTESAFVSLKTTCSELQDSTGQVRRLLRLPDVEMDDSRLESQARLAQCLLDSDGPPQALLRGRQREAQERVAKWCGDVTQRTELAACLGEHFDDSVLELDLAPLRQRFERWAGAFFLIAFFALFVSRWRLRRHARGRLPSNGTVAEQLMRAQRVQLLDRKLFEEQPAAQAMLGSAWKGLDTDVVSIEALMDWARRTRSSIHAQTAGALDPEVIERLIVLATDQAEHVAPDTEAGRTLNLLLSRWRGYRDARKTVAAALEPDEDLAFGQGKPLARVSEVVDLWIREASRLHDWCYVAEASHRGREIGLGPIVDALRSGDITPAMLEDVFVRSVYQWWWEGVRESEPVLQRFRAEEHERLIAEFRSLDERIHRAAREVVRARLAARVPDVHGPGDELALLRRQLQLKSRHMPLRRQFARMPTVLRRLKPCLLMSPLSVAQYLSPELEGFDVVVFDEASQIPPWDAVGAIARGQRVIVVGDTKQLPPTTFFDRSYDDEGEQIDDDDLLEVESILDEARASGMPPLDLRWHYRSQHESLIAFSNHQYYGGRLHTFPSARHREHGLGVELVRVEGGVYDRGGSRTNRREAEVLLAELTRLLSPADGSVPPSVGVVTFSLPQQRLIEDLTDQLCLDRPELLPHFSDGVVEPVFVKNLENVQGDERDVILFSVCYGPDRAGKVLMNFGPLNRLGGERRLNVAITRARRRTVLFSTLTAEDIDLRRTRAEGAAHLKEYLSYAAHGISALSASTDGGNGETESPFEEDVMRALRAEGWRVDCQVGCSGYRIDLAVADPKRPGVYLLGVECDGATYHSSRCARERDRLRQHCLESLGWRIHRVWSTEWWLDREREMERLTKALRDAEAGRRPHRQSSSPAPPPLQPQIRASTTPPVASGRAAIDALLAEAPSSRPLPSNSATYPTVDVADLGTKESFYEAGELAHISQRLVEVVRALGPIHKDEAARLVIECWSLRTLGRRIREKVDAARRATPVQDRPVPRGSFLWPAGVDADTWDSIRVPGDNPRTRRDAHHIPPEEVANAATWVVERALSISVEDLHREMAAVFGIRRLGKKVREAMQAGIEVLAARGRCSVEDGRVRRLE